MALAMVSREAQEIVSRRQRTVMEALAFALHGSLYAAARHVGLSTGTLYNVVNGLTPGEHARSAIEDHFGLPIAELLAPVTRELILRLAGSADTHA